MLASVAGGAPVADASVVALPPAGVSVTDQLVMGEPSGVAIVAVTGVVAVTSLPLLGAMLVIVGG